MESPRLFAALVTYEGSRFNVGGKAQAALRELAVEGASRGFNVTTMISDRDDFPELGIKISRRLVASSAALQAWTEFRWRRYLAGGRGDSARTLLRDWLLLIAMLIKREWDYFGKNPLKSGSRLPGARAITRLLNIDLSHMRIYREVLDSETEWALVIEDDARPVSDEDLWTVLSWVMSRDVTEAPQIVNLSESISHEKLGVVGILDAYVGTGNELASALVPCRRPVTNTVCANLFNREFVKLLLLSIETHGLTPVIPIDWRLNRMIMDAWKLSRLNSSSCTWIVPGLFLQGSMHAVGGTSTQR